MPSARALWREGGVRAATVAKQRLRQHLVWPAKRSAKELVRHLVPVPATLHGIPWGPGEMLVMTRNGTRLLCPTEDLSLSPQLALTGTYDQAFTDFLKRRLRMRMTFVDVGANVGLSTVLAASRVGAGGRVFAYECNTELIGFLRRNVEMSWFDDRVRTMPCAAHRDDEERLLRVPRIRKLQGSLTRFNGSEAEAGELQEFRVPCERLDVGLADVPFIDLMRIDVEGSEVAVLDGASGLLDEGRVGVIAMGLRDDPMSEGFREETDKALTSLVQDRGATLHVLGDRRSIPLDEVLTVFDYPQLLIRFPNATIE